MSLFRVSNNRAQFDAAGNEASDQYGAGIRFTQGGNARVTTGSATNYNQGIPMSATGQVAIVDATAGLPAGTIFHNGLPISGDKVCVSRNATAVVSNGMPYDAAGAVAGDINFDLNFVDNGTLNPSVTFTRTGTTATYFNSAGVLTSAGADVPRFDYNPTTLAAQGLLIEEARTNSIRNNTMQGAVAGTPGTLPQVSGSASWSVVPNGITGMSSSVIGTGIENGVTYIDIRINGTPSASVAQGVQILFETQTGVTASASQTWTESAYLKLAAGSTANIANFRFNMQQFNAGVFVQSNSTVITAPSATLTRASATSTLGAGTTTHILPLLGLETTSGAPIDITLRIGLPQLEQGAFATSVIPTTVAQVTRNADQASVNTLSPWFNSTAGTLYAEYAVSGFASASAFPSTAALSDGTGNNRINLASTNTGASLYSYGEVQAGGAPQAGFYGASGSPFGVGTARKVAIAYSANDFAFTTQGLAVQADPSGTVPTVDRLYLGVASNGTTQFQNGYLRRVTYYPRRLTNAELQAITA